MDLFTFELSTIFSFLLTFMRSSLVIFMLPVFGADSLPAQWKALFIVVFTFTIWPQVALQGTDLPAHPFNLALMLLGELFLGITLGLCVKFFFSGLQAGGELITLQMGFSMITFADPNTGSQTGVLAHMIYMISTLIFLAFDGHLYMLKAFVETYNYIPAGGVMITDSLVKQVLTLSNMLFVFAIKIVSPVLVALFLAEVGLALMSKVAPQMNIMEMGFPIKILVGFFFLGMIFTLLQTEIYNYIVGLDDLFMNLIHSMSPQFQPTGE